MIKKNKNPSDSRFLELIQRSKKGKFKLYIGMIAGVGKSYRMLEDARSLLQNGINVKIGFIETHGRVETEKLLEGLPIIPRKKIFYKGKELDEMDVQTILNIKPEIVVVDELAHSNIPGTKNEKRWQDVVEILDAGINVISAVNIQHIESLNEEIGKITGIEVQERIPDYLLSYTDEIVNIDLSADELIERLKDGNIYHPSKIQIAIENFFQPEKILQLRELALKEVAGQVERKIEKEVFADKKLRPERFLACISSNASTTANILRKTGRITNLYSAKWYVLYVQTPNERFDRINLADQRHLLNNFKLATQLDAEIIRVKSENITDAIFNTAIDKGITTIIIGKPNMNFFKFLFRQNILKRLLRKLPGTKIDIIILS